MDGRHWAWLFKCTGWTQEYSRKKKQPKNEDNVQNSRRKRWNEDHKMYEAIAPPRLTGPLGNPCMSARGQQENSFLQCSWTGKGSAVDQCCDCRGQCRGLINC